MEDRDLIITSTLTIPRAELEFRTSRSSGPGGQHVNTSETRVELLFDVKHSPSLGPAHRATLMEALAHRLDSRGVLHLASQAHRSQSANKEEVVRRLKHVLAQALRPRRSRKPSRPTAASRRRRLEQKRRRSKTKAARRRVRRGDDDQ